ncbi:hypothetical protein [Flavobacterium sp. J27]|uniref:hypothetical protein n=1 Tax=Flavobacterium sp. J27 TaxID=2060419 RepID=UPI0010309FC5|nr:hypothetical protein [Flavobacterium sp. J27]
MRNYLLLLTTLFLSYLPSLAQVGINETEPKATLHINGDAIIESVPKLSTPLQKIITLNASNNRIEYVEAEKSFVKGFGGAGFSVLGTTLISGWNQISFPNLEFDENADYNTTNQYFVAPMNGIYNVAVYVKMTSLVNVSNLGVGIFKYTGGTTTLIADESYESLSVTILGIGVTSPPVRNTQTLVKLNTGDRIYFGIRSSNLVVFNNAEAQFSIFQVK